MAAGNAPSAVSTHEDARTRLHSPDLQSLMRSLRATLTDLDFAHAQELSRLETKRMDARLRGHIIETLRKRHHEHREPYVRELARLQTRMKAALAAA
ncbi:hypothetical protein QNA08_16980 [Chelatococcus sp. SYSU_G07232]|uniref:DUF465 domain-containing protein n=1 Tax=Chelatococcus albus TaxID=3047466 RepID=A0ABT7AKL9_9HYPH|nr:hypothetical protein [Chelatococcus sp. SYSU_G07232]MDJ1159914.1 hypothetical protein [Chelatococcus sp. SYSU_G07232]